MLIDNPGPTGTNHDSPFVLFTEHRIAAQQAQLARARQLVEQYRNAHDIHELIVLQKELLTILSGYDDDGHNDNIVIAAKFTAELYRQCGVVVDVEVVCDLLTRFRLELLPTIKEAQ